MESQTANKNYEAVVVGVSAGAFNALTEVFSLLPSDFFLPIVVVVHLGPASKQDWIRIISERIKLKIKEADEKEAVLPSCIYIGPPNYHLMVNDDKTLSLSVDPKVNFARPSIDVLFESAAHVYNKGLIGLVLTGANNDGAAGMKLIKQAGGLTIVQDPAEAEFKEMPASVIAVIKADHVLPLKEIGILLTNIHNENSIVKTK